MCKLSSFLYVVVLFSEHCPIPTKLDMGLYIHSNSNGMNFGPNLAELPPILDLYSEMWAEKYNTYF